MGLFTKIIGAKIASKAVQRLSARSTAATGTYVPATTAASGSRASVLTDRATQIYKQNPKLVTTVAAGALAVFLAGVLQRRKRPL